MNVVIVVFVVFSFFAVERV